MYYDAFDPHADPQPAADHLRPTWRRRALGLTLLALLVLMHACG